MATTHAHPRMQTPTRENAQTAPDGPSPTLTNPDMILPYQEQQDSSPTPLVSFSTLDFTKCASPTRANAFTLEPPDSSAEVGVAKTFAVSIRTKPPPPKAVNLLYQGYEHGAPLEVIGEEETTPKKKKSQHGRNSSDAPSTPTHSTASAQNYARRLSGQSDSSLSAGSDGGKWEEFEALRTSNPRLKADLAADNEDNADLDGLDSKRSSGLLNSDDDMKRAERILANAKKRLTTMEDNLTKARTSIFVSPRSSPIMGEHQPAGGLYRSISLGADRRQGQSPHHRKSKALYPVIKNVKAGHNRGSSETAVPTNSARLSRVPVRRSASALDYNVDHSIDSMLQDGSPQSTVQEDSPGSVRSFNMALNALQEEDASPSSKRTSPENILPHGLGISTDSNIVQDLASAGQTNGVSQENGLSRSVSQSSTRSARELRDQMTGLKSKIVDLKARAQADNLRRQSLQNLRAPSPFGQAAEQWYAAAAEYKSGESPLSANAGLGWSPQQERNSALSTPRTPDHGNYEMNRDGTPVPSSGPVRTDINTPNLHQVNSGTGTGYGQEGSPVQPSHYEDAFEEVSSEPEDEVGASEEEQIYLNEALEESLQEAEPEFSSMTEESDSFEEPERHEDRFDAFDYENMFLHSALGNYSQNGFKHGHNRSNSDDSETSNASGETAKAAEADDGEDERDSEGEEEDEEDDNESQLTESASHLQQKDNRYGNIGNCDSDLPKPPHAPWAHARSNSLDSVSSTATFATATEGGGDSETESDTIPSEILNWGNPPSNLTSFGGFPSPPSTSPILGMQSRAARKGPTPLTASETVTDPNAGSRMARATPAGSLPTPPEVSPKNPQHQNFSQGQQPSPKLQRPPNTEILLASLITLADPSFRHPSSTSPPGAAANLFTNVDKDLVLELLGSVGAVCKGILASDGRGEVYESRVWRRRLDAAKRVLSGEIEIEEE